MDLSPVARLVRALAAWSLHADPPPTPSAGTPVADITPFVWRLGAPLLRLHEARRRYPQSRRQSIPSLPAAIEAQRVRPARWLRLDGCGRAIEIITLDRAGRITGVTVMDRPGRLGGRRADSVLVTRPGTAVRLDLRAGQVLGIGVARPTGPSASGRA